MKSKLIKDKKFKNIVDFLEQSLGTHAAGSMIAILADAINDLTDGVEARNIRTIEIKFNDFYSTKFDFERGEYV